MNLLTRYLVTTSICMLATIVQALPQSLELYQLQTLLKHVETAKSRPVDYLLEQEAIPMSAVDKLLDGVANLVDGTIHPQDIVCGKATIAAISKKSGISTSNSNERLQAIGKLGPLVLWTSMQFKEFIKNPGAQTDTQCARLQKIRDVFEKLDEFDDLSSAEIDGLRISLLQKAEKEVIEGVETISYMYVPALTEAKAALLRFQEGLLHAASNPAHDIGNLLFEQIKAKAPIKDIVDNIEVRDAAKTLIHQTLLREKSLVVFDYVQRLTGDAREAIHLLSNDVEVIEDAYSQASRSYEQFNDLKRQSEPQYFEKQKQLVRIDSYISLLAKTLKISVDTQAKTIERLAKAKASNILEENIDQLCEKLKNDAPMQQRWTSNQWGEMPTEQKPFGYRFTATPIVSDTEKQLYHARMELLVWTPNSEFIMEKVANEIKLNNSCKQTNASSYRAVDMGITLIHVYRTGTARYVANGFINDDYDGLRSNAVVDQEGFAMALESLGVLGTWAPESPVWTIDEQFQNVIIDMKVPSIPPLQLVKDGEFSFSPAQLGLQVCKAIESNLVLNSLNKWTKQVKLPLKKGWRITLDANASAKVALTRCKQHYQVIKDNVISPIATPAPLATSEVALSAKLVIKGMHRGEAFEWPVTVAANAASGDQGLSGKVTFKSALFGDIPQVFKSHADEALALLKKQWKFSNEPNGLTLTARLGSVGTVNSFESISVPLLVEISTDSCATQTVSTRITLPSGKITINSYVLKKKVKKLLTCKAKNLVLEASSKMVNCDKVKQIMAKKPLFGLTDAMVTVSDPSGHGNQQTCRVAIAGNLFGKPVKVIKITARFKNGETSFDFLKAEGEASFIKPLEERVKVITGFLADRGVTVKPGEFKNNALPVDIILHGTTTPFDTGKINIGTVTLSADGGLSLKSELDRVLAERLSTILSDRVTAVAREYAPKTIKNLKAKISYDRSAEPGKSIKASAKFDFKFHEDMSYIPASIKLLPKIGAKLDIDKNALKGVVAKELQTLLDLALPLKGGPVEIDPLEYISTPDMNVTFKTGVTIDLKELSKIKVTDVHIGTKGVSLQGRVELSVGFDLVLVVAPVPVYLTNPGIFYDFNKKVVGGLGGLTVFAPKISELVKIDASLSIGDPGNFLETLVLTGDLVLLDSLPIVTTRGELDFKEARATFDGETSKLMEKVLSAQVNGFMDAKTGITVLKSKLRVFGIDLSKNNIRIDMKACPNECINASMEMKIPIGNGTATIVTGPFLVDGKLKVVIDFKVFSQNLGSARIEVEVLRAKLGARIFKLIDLNVATPRMNDMSPDYIAKIIASLLDVSLDDIKEWLKKPKIEIKPAGKPKSSSPSSNGKEKNDPAGSPPTSGAEEKQVQSVGGSAPAEAKGATRISGNFPPQRSLSEEYNVVACRDSDKSWGFAHYHGNQKNWHYWPQYNLNKHSYKRICDNNKIQGRRLSGTKATLINDIYRPVQRNSSSSYTLGEPECKNVDNNRFSECETPFANHNVRYYESDLQTGYMEPRGELNTRTRVFSRSANPGVGKTVESAVTIEIKERLREKLEDLDEDADLRQKELKQHILEQHELRVEETFAIETSWTSGWFSETEKIKVFYKKRQKIPSAESEEAVVIWASIQNGAVGDAVFVSHCLQSRRNGKPASNCKKNEGDRQDRDALKMLRGGGSASVKDKVDIVVEPRQTSWILNVAIPSILSGLGVPQLAEPVAINKQIATCDIKGIEYTQTSDKLSYRFERRLENSRQFEITLIDVAKYGAHKDWSASGNQNYLIPMANFLACEPSPTRWLREHHLWTSPVKGDPTVGTALLFEKKIEMTEAYEEVLEITETRKPRTFLAQRKMPYGRTTDQLKHRFYGLVAKHDGSRYSVIVNTRDKWEILVLESQLRKGTYLEVRDCDTGEEKPKCTKGIPFKQPLKRTTKLSSNQMETCLGKLDVGVVAEYPTRLLAYLHTLEPVRKYGQGPLMLFQKTNNRQLFGCEFR